jgi:hypothetical protein
MNNEIASIEIPGERLLVEYRRIFGLFGLPSVPMMLRHLPHVNLM